MIANSDADAFERYLKRFIDEHIRPLPTRSFNSVEDYESMSMLMFHGWRLLKEHPCSYPSKLKELESIIKMIDQFDDHIERPIQLKTLRSMGSHPSWRNIQNKARTIC